MSTAHKIRSILKIEFKARHLSVHDESSLHAGHAEAMKQGGGHFAVILVSEVFRGQPLRKRHGLIYDALKPLMGKDIHALQIRALTPEEFNAPGSPIA
ncbi:MAG: BolA family protein [Candidatus Omnitrophota bacterium]|nr:BolA family protein [Candidatus Omnitrophota bacterium]MDZ4242634.1 BolA family protein [Candidatus Omnitrophota bacterium]